MASLSVRKLDNDIVNKLRVRAAQNGISMEEEIRQILTQAVSSPTCLGDMAMALFGESGIDIELVEHPPHKPVNLF